MTTGKIKQMNVISISSKSMCVKMKQISKYKMNESIVAMMQE